MSLLTIAAALLAAGAMLLGALLAMLGAAHLVIAGIGEARAVASSARIAGIAIGTFGILLFVVGTAGAARLLA